MKFWKIKRSFLAFIYQENNHKVKLSRPESKYYSVLSCKESKFWFVIN